MNWETNSFNAHDGGVTSLAWGPTSDPCMLVAENHDHNNAQPVTEKSYVLKPKRFVSGGMDGNVKIW